LFICTIQRRENFYQEKHVVLLGYEHLLLGHWGPFLNH
jgi:hypothetical protein